MMEITNKLESLMLPVIEKQGCELVELDVKGSGKTRVVRVVVWKEGGIGVDECAYLSNKLSELLDTEEIFDTRYYLEVSSPGLDRPLHTLRDFQMRRNEKVELFTVDGKSHKGTLIDATVDGVLLQIDDDNKLFEWKEVSKGKIIVETKK